MDLAIFISDSLMMNIFNKQDEYLDVVQRFDSVDSLAIQTPFYESKNTIGNLKRY
ncbi:conserved hypothetical protein [Vibrio chagasii]|nr:conserved hypothetical protein [Vibrio chagasii]CAH6964147.1 conserved hypothetical protein [Vibrio chagasii]CAH6980481.1 conserved hypothetical protein [Vibrio chagasii]CAH7100517.1 conserved hypothetical protein [Vibrio chagasii]CAH7101921.1 conserved hypothetical protein [Vibrio chagasii]